MRYVNVTKNNTLFVKYKCHDVPVLKALELQGVSIRIAKTKFNGILPPTYTMFIPSVVYQRVRRVIDSDFMDSDPEIDDELVDDYSAYLFPTQLKADEMHRFTATLGDLKMVNLLSSNWNIFDMGEDVLSYETKFEHEGLFNGKSKYHESFFKFQLSQDVTQVTKMVFNPIGFVYILGQVGLTLLVIVYVLLFIYAFFTC